MNKQAQGYPWYHYEIRRSDDDDTYEIVLTLYGDPLEIFQLGEPAVRRSIWRRGPYFIEPPAGLAELIAEAQQQHGQP